jgi:ABC-2 type transport system permease protein
LNSARDFLVGLKWVPHVFSNEIKKAVSYRVAFWIQFIVGTATDMFVAYFLWRAIFQIRGETVLQGFTFHGIVYYYLFASFAFKIARGGEWGYIAQEIYDGGLTRYLLYPLHFLGYKYVTHITQQLLSLFQLTIAFLVLRLILGLPEELHITLMTFMAGAMTSLLAGYLHFMMASALEMVSFWQDVVWNLMAMLRFITSLVGGAMIPLAFFPEWGRKIASVTPFAAIITFPAKVFLGEVSLSDWFYNVGLIAVWSLVFSIACAWIWSRGTKHYTGVGI